MGYMDHKYTILNKTNADGAQTVDLSDHRRKSHHQIKVALSTSASAGSLSVQIKSPGADEWDTIGSIDMTSASQKIMQFSGNAESIRFYPSSFDADKTYSIYGYVYGD